MFYSNIFFIEELVDKQNRDRLWDIYFGTSFDTKNQLTRTESGRIRRIEKRLATIKRNQHLTQNTFISPSKDIQYVRSRPHYRRAISQLPSETAITLRRRSSFDQQALDRWKALANQSKSSEQFPRSFRKLMIRK
jgi:hypothetical protein